MPPQFDQTQHTTYRAPSGYVQVTGKLTATPGNLEFLRGLMANFDRDVIGYAVVKHRNGKLQLYRQPPKRKVPSEHRRTAPSC